MVKLQRELWSIKETLECTFNRLPISGPREKVGLIVLPREEVIFSIKAELSQQTVIEPRPAGEGEVDREVDLWQLSREVTDGRLRMRKLENFTEWNVLHFVTEVFLLDVPKCEENWNSKKNKLHDY